ncbi:hypothetical protein SAMN04487785_10159 [Dyella jiangningensis]|uniref:hypothetical protein n=1 Tax=Dyella sp. AtDHG13 TaxID=1938897 RepID=UPI0008853A43|nr:hypothetical protein [Dyella sp. AtDHG13]PXV59498.1 hypothetical protein BDW41_10328 [Dyella sp. AtDHG13]SDJ15779.1 hypothetical protein SAMN04487785_10159 [Dyella jiangningensis]
MKRTLRSTLPWLSLIVIGAVVYALRYTLVESPDVAHLCDTAASFQCTVRHVAVMGFILAPLRMSASYSYQMGIYGWVALAAAVLALSWKKPFAAWLAAATGTVAVILYCFVPGAFALLVGCLRLVRLQSDGAAPLDHHRAGGREIHAQP